MSIPGSSLIPQSLRIPRCGNWLPEDTWILRTWLSNIVSFVDVHPKPLHPVIHELQCVIEEDAGLFMLFNDMFEQIPLQKAYARDPFGASYVRDYKHMLRLFNEVLLRAPLFAESELIGLPMNAILDWPMSTSAGQAAFLSSKLNIQVKKVLDVWAAYLQSEASASVINESQTGWLGPPALAAMRISTSSRRTPHWTFESTFVCNRSLPHFGFTSWDDFFTRRFQPGVRPIASPLDHNVIINPCECAPYRIYRYVRRIDRFWVKSQPYSLEHMLARHPLVSRFVGGTLFQAFLDAVNYHRWHAPVAGIIRHVEIVPGTYFSQALGYGVPTEPQFNMENTNIQCENQAYVAAVATRCVIILEAENPAIGMVAVVFVGMADVSTCDAFVTGGQKVKKGDELGTFRFGGSSVVMVLEQGVDLRWDLHGQEVVVKKRARLLAAEPPKKREIRGKLHQDEFRRGWRGEALGM
ncbi:phosphatidylserine decarboxylase [Calycina marina]|uniref:Phosphatidylserine decarboxylase n=1 Tax=Calycina marina TaxID=1763456 RepID=A0A9P7YV62_9HELO|nr:phosphatidylserine decarboxylase [Calycina marina]